MLSDGGVFTLGHKTYVLHWACAVDVYRNVLIQEYSLQGRLDAVDVDAAIEYVLKCMNFDGGFGRVPGSESHAGQVSCPTPLFPAILLLLKFVYTC